MPTINIDISPSTLRPDGTEDEMNDYGAIMSHVYYGRGMPPTDDETIANIVQSFRLAQRAWGTVYLVWDEEDTGFGGEDSELERIFDESIDDDTHALMAWWASYGFASGKEAEPLRRKIAELAQVDYRHLEECQ